MKQVSPPPLVHHRVEEVSGIAGSAIPYDDLLAGNRPVILKGAVNDWPLVKAGRESAQTAIAYLRQFDGGKPILAFRGDAEIQGRFFYNDDITAFNFTGERLSVQDGLDEISAAIPEEAGADYYVGSTDLDHFLPGFRAENDLPLDHPMFGQAKPLVSLWMGNRSTATAHYDISYNMALCVVGHRRFTLFPPDQIANLYPGPLEPTPGGQVVSMVNFQSPDFDAHPNFSRALEAAQVAELEPGDLLYYPAMWWHHVEALDRFNALVNYWWNVVPSSVDSPMVTLLHGFLSLRNRPEEEKRAWQALFDFYLFGDQEQSTAHLPAYALGDLGELDTRRARILRQKLLQRLNR